MKEQIYRIVIDCLKALNEELEVAALADPTPATPLYGPKSPLDSLNLVNLIADIEGQLGETFEQDIVLADERAMSQTRSPFRTVSSLTEYIETLIKQNDS